MLGRGEGDIARTSCAAPLSSRPWGLLTFPDWLPDPGKATETVNVHKLGEMLLATVKKGLGIDFAS